MTATTTPPSLDAAPATVGAAVAAARAAQPGWEAIGPRERGAWLRRYAAWLQAHEEELAALLQAETGKPWAEATFEVPFALDLIGYCARTAPRALAESHPRPHGLLTTGKSLSVACAPTRSSASSAPGTSRC